jgi:hypothetical protein
LGGSIRSVISFNIARGGPAFQNVRTLPLGPEPDDNAGAAKLMNVTLGDVLLAGVLKYSQGAGRIIAEAIAQAEMPIVAAKTRESKVGPESETAAETKDETNAKAPATLMASIAK